MHSPKKYEYIDLIRGIAILCVIATHCHQKIYDLLKITTFIFNYGQLGVQLFFIASALTLCLSMSERNETSLKEFYLRRLFRIAPLYYFGIILYFFSDLIRGYHNTGQLTIGNQYTTIALFENIFFLHGFDPKNFNYIVPGGWSIATEFYFYAIFPFLFTIQKKYKFSKFLIFVISTVILSFTFQFLAIELIQPLLISKGFIQSLHLNDGFGFIYCSIFNQINIFLIGILTFKALKINKVPKTLVILAFVLILASLFLLNSTNFKTGYNGFFYPLLSAISFGIISVGLSKIKEFKSIFAKIIIRVGQLSFSMYILHFIFLDIMNFLYQNFLFKYIKIPEVKLVILYATVIVISYFSAQVTRSVIEVPGMNMRKRITK